MRNGEVLSLFEAYRLIKRFSNVSGDGWVMIVCRLVREFENKLDVDEKSMGLIFCPVINNLLYFCRKYVKCLNVYR